MNYSNDFKFKKDNEFDRNFDTDDLATNLEGDLQISDFVWKGLNELDSEEFKHFQEYRNDYFYYGGPNYMDRNDPRAELSECELAFESDSRVICLEKNQL